jgi:hypothetical protein
MWDLEAAAVADMVRQRGDAVTLLTAEQIAPWRKVTEPVITAWLRQMKERKINGGKLIAGVRALLAKYANEPEPQPPEPPEPKVATQPEQAAQAKAATPKADAPAAPLAKPAPAAKPAPLKELDIPL